MTDQTQTAGDRPGDPCAMVIFGAAGDLTRRKLLPSLANLARNGLLNPRFAIIGFAIDELGEAEFRSRMQAAIAEFSAGELDPALWQQLSDGMRYVRGDFADPAAYARLGEALAAAAAECGTGGNVIFYLATPPKFFGEIAGQ